jgi:hypothetical protein
MNLLSASDRVLHNDPLSSSALFKPFLDERGFCTTSRPAPSNGMRPFKALQRESGQSSPLLTKSSLQSLVVGSDIGASSLFQ